MRSGNLTLFDQSKNLMLFKFMLINLFICEKSFALQPLEDFVAAAREQNYDNKTASLTLEQREAEKGQSWMKLAPVLSVVGGPSKNQYSTEITLPQPQGGQRTITTVPKDQQDLTVGLSLPLVDVGNWKRVAAAKANARAAAAHRDATVLEIDQAIVRAYYQLIAASATEEAMLRAQKVAEQTLNITLERKSSDVASLLDVKRAEADVERSKQNVADSSYNLAVATRTLRTLSGLSPNATKEKMPSKIDDDLHDEGPLSQWEATLTPSLPAINAAHLERIAAEKTKSAVYSAYLPTLAANISQHYTNAAGISGHESSYSVGVTLNWRLDPGTPYSVDGQIAALKTAAIREEKALTDAKDRLYLTWEQIHFQIAKSRAARAQDSASREAMNLMQQKYAAGAATLLDVSQAERDSLSAEVSRIQADGDLIYARALLRLNTGQPLGTKQKSSLSSAKKEK